ncbi:MAG: M23 family metallopeptidase, partial [Polyangiales bacterium]
MTPPRPHRQLAIFLALLGLVAVPPRLQLRRAYAEPSVIPAPIESSSIAPIATPKPATERCTDGWFIDDGACVRLPDDDAFGEDPVGAPEQEAVNTGHFERSGHWTAYEQIPRRPDRPTDYDAYLYPIPPGLPGGHSVVSGYDLDLPDNQQRRGRMRAVGHGGVDLPQKRGTSIHLVPLEHQVGDAIVVFAGPLFGDSVVTRHVVREGGRDRDYVLIFGHLDRAAPGLARGSVLRDGDVVGFVGDTGSPELVHLHLEARRV